MSTVAKRVYDVAILGPDVGGAAAAALCAKKGLRTLMAPLQPGTRWGSARTWRASRRRKARSRS